MRKFDLCLLKTQVSPSLMITRFTCHLETLYHWLHKILIVPLLLELLTERFPLFALSRSPSCNLRVFRDLTATAVNYPGLKPK